MVLLKTETKLLIDKIRHFLMLDIIRPHAITISRAKFYSTVLFQFSTYFSVIFPQKNAQIELCPTQNGSTLTEVPKSIL